MKERQYPESKMSPLVSVWIESQGFTPFAEVPYHSSCVDFVGANESELIAVEMKISLTKEVRMQAYRNAIFADRTYAAVSSKPRQKSIEDATKWGIGVLYVHDGTVSLVANPPPRREAWDPEVKGMRERLANLTPGGVAGMPQIAGVGPAQSVFDAVAEYRKGNPDATWQQIFENVPNHYKHARSMQGALSYVPGRRRHREEQQKWREQQRGL